MKWRCWLVVAITLIALQPSLVLARNDEPDLDDALIRIGANQTVPSGETVQTLIVVDGDATVDGTVQEDLWVFSGNAVVSGTIQGDVTVISGDLTLNDGARVDGDVNISDGDLTRAPTASIGGDVEYHDWTIGKNYDLFLSSLGFWLGMTITMLILGLLLVRFAGRQMQLAASAFARRFGRSLLYGILLAVILPIIAVLAIVTIVGIPVGVGILLFLIPICFIAGSLVVALAAGRLILRGLGRTRSAGAERPYLAMVLGVIIIAALMLIPALNFLLAIVISILGAGAIAVALLHRPPAEPEPAIPPTAPAGVTPALPDQPS
jgi:cytoskeletal protein CcmA (bactofilin family)